MSVGAIIVGAGASRRAGFDKVFARLGDRPVLAHSVAVFQGCPAVHHIVIVLAARNLERGRLLAASEGWTKVRTVCTGGRRRQDSVAAGLSELENCEWVVIHDAARPLVSTDLIEAGLARARVTGAAVAAVPVTDTIKVVNASGAVVSTPDRSQLWAVQTPQVFRRDLLASAYQCLAEEVTDDARCLELRGISVEVFPGHRKNIKITLPGDLELAEFYLGRKSCPE